MPITPEFIVEKVYDIALDPSHLESLVDVWTEAGMDSVKARATTEAIFRADETYKTHLSRAKTFLERGDTLDDRDSLQTVLKPFENLAAFIVDDQRTVRVCNDSAKGVHALDQGDGVNTSSLPERALGALSQALDQAFEGPDGGQYIVKTHLSAAESPLVMQVRRLPRDVAGEHTLCLVVTTSYHWTETLGPLLNEVFDLTLAEQAVVRLLVEGKNAKEIAHARDTSEGTVRGQLKAILKKMGARSQSEVIRLVVHLQSVSKDKPETGAPKITPREIGPDWLESEVWAPFKTVTLPDGRRMDYHEMGPANGAPVLFSHMGYAMVRWHAPMLKRAYAEGLRVICPIRPGFGQSDNLDPDTDTQTAIREDTLFLMDHLNLGCLPYVIQGNDLVFAIDLASKHPDRVSEIIGLGARPYMHGEMQYAGMKKWHRFFLSTAKQSPHLLRFTARAWISMLRRVGGEAMFRNAHKDSPADLAMGNDQELMDVLLANCDLVASKTSDASQAYATELFVTENPWDHLIYKARSTPTWFLNGSDDPLMDVAAIAAYRETYPWIDIEVIPNGGQLLIYQHFETILPRIAAAAKRARSDGE